MKKLTLYIGIASLLTSCALIEKSREARYQNQTSTPMTLGSNSDRYSNQPQMKPKVLVRRTYINYGSENAQSSKYPADVAQIAYELGYDPRGTLTPQEMRSVETRKKVRELERRLDSNREKEQYAKALPVMTSDQEKLDFLSIPSVEGRQAWMNKNGILSRAKSPSPEMRDAMESQDIALQMPMDFVRKAWGEPAAVEVSGNPIYRNERWKYQRYVSTPDGYRSEKRFVYFEGGKVIGWETE